MEILSAGGGRQGDKIPQQTNHEASGEASRIRVLVVEDDWLVSLDIEAALLAAGYSVVGIADSADEAIGMAAQLRPDVATMDIRLRGPRDGIQAANELYQRFGLRCLFVSAYSNGTTKERAAAAKPLGWLQKPFFASQLVVALQGALRNLE
jgi:CheY-like chemotaxis protein